MKHRIFLLFLGIILALSGLIRFTNLYWDAGGRLHPDEGLIVSAASQIHWFTKLNPRFHDYNGFSVYLLSAATTLTSHPTLESMTLLGRYISASISIITVLLFYMLCVRLFPPMIALIVTALFSFSPLLIQLAHFYTTDSIIVCFLTILLLFLQSYTKKPTQKSLLGMGIAMGLAIATKNTGYLFLPLPLMVILWSKATVQQKLSRLTLMGIATVGVFFLASPYSFIDIYRYIDVSLNVSRIVSGTFKPDWALQFQGTTPWYWFIQTLYAFGPLAVLGPIAIVYVLKIHKAHKEKIFALSVSMWTIGFSVFLACTYLKFTRYDAPLGPFYALAVGWLLTKTQTNKHIFLGVLSLVAIQIIYGMMFFSIYTTPHTSLLATHWLGENLPTNAKILREDWNYIIQYNGDDLMAKHLYIDTFNFYTTPDSPKVDKIIEKILANDYITLDSPKVRNTTKRLHEKYPYTSTYYALLESGALGFAKIAEFNNYPRLGRFVLNDEYAEETFTTFDHPTVRIYKKQRQLTQKELYLMLTSGIR